MSQPLELTDPRQPEHMLEYHPADTAGGAA